MFVSHLQPSVAAMLLRITFGPEFIGVDQYYPFQSECQGKIDPLLLQAKSTWLGAEDEDMEGYLFSTLSPFKKQT